MGRRPRGAASASRPPVAGRMRPARTEVNKPPMCRIRGASEVARRRSRSSQRGYGGPKAQGGGGVSPSRGGRRGTVPAHACIVGVESPRRQLQLSIRVGPSRVPRVLSEGGSTAAAPRLRCVGRRGSGLHRDRGGARGDRVGRRGGPCRGRSLQDNSYRYRSKTKTDEPSRRGAPRAAREHVPAAATLASQSLSTYSHFERCVSP
jgi:hypothetical protein